MRNGNARVVFWDFDGTLASRNGLWSSTLAAALRIVAPDYGVTAESFRQELSVGFPWHAPDILREALSPESWWAAQHSLFLRAYSKAGVPAELAGRAIAQIPTEYYRPSAWTLAPDAVSALGITALAGYRNAILSNHAPELPILVRRLGLDRWIDATITSAAIGAEKPNARIFTHAIDVLNAGEDVWMIGDNPIADIAGAESVKIRGILIGPGVTLTAAATRVAEEGRRNAG